MKALPTYCLPDLLRVEDAVRPSECPGEDSTQEGWSPHRKVINVAGFLKDDLLSSPSMGHKGNLITHGPGRDIERCLLSQALGCQRLQAVHRRVFAINIISHDGASHGLPHHLSGDGYGITSQVHERLSLPHRSSYLSSHTVRIRTIPRVGALSIAEICSRRPFTQG